MSGRVAREMKRDFLWNSVGSFLYALTSLVLMIIATRVNGLDAAGAFTFAFANACVFQVVGTYVGRAYQVTERKKGVSDNDYVYNRVVSCLVMLVLGVLYGVVSGFTGLQLGLVVILIVYKMLDAFAEVWYGILQKNGKLYKVGISFLMKAVMGVVGFLAVDVLTKDLALASGMLVVVNLAVTIFYDIRECMKVGYRFERVENKNYLKLFKSGFFVFLLTLLTQYLFNASRYAIEATGDEGMQAIYGMLIMPATVMVLMSQFVVQPALNKIKELLEKKRIKELNKMTIRVSAVLLVIGGAGVGLGYALGVWLYELLYGVDITEYLGSLAIIIAGATVFGVSYVLQNVLIAMRKTAAQAGIFVMVSALTLALSGMMVAKWQMMGGAGVYAGSMGLLLIFYVVIYVWYIRKEKNEG